jgi:diaminopimelate decarboxylase
LDYHLPQEKFPNLRIIATPGRFFAASVYSLVTNIIDRRTVDASEITENGHLDLSVSYIYYSF